MKINDSVCEVRVVDADLVASTRARVISTDEAAEVAQLFKLLGEPTRARILHALAEADELCVCDLAAVCDVTETVVSHAMRLLRAARVVRSRRQGRTVHYRLDDDHVRSLIQLSLDHLRHDVEPGSTGSGAIR